MIGLLLFACTSGSPRTWQVLDPVAIHEVIAEPTATQRSASVHLEELIEVALAALDLSGLPEHTLAGVLASADTPQPAVTDDLVTGTQVYLEVGCPGPAAQPDPEFSHGLARIESPLLLEPDLTPIVGPLHLSLLACELKSTTVHADFRARWIAEEQRLLASGSLAFQPEHDGRAVVLDATEGALLLSVPFGGETVTVAVLERAIELRFADGLQRCAISETGLTCEQ